MVKYVLPLSLHEAQMQILRQRRLLSELLEHHLETANSSDARFLVPEEEEIVLSVRKELGS